MGTCSPFIDDQTSRFSLLGRGLAKNAIENDRANNFSPKYFLGRVLFKSPRSKKTF